MADPEFILVRTDLNSSITEASRLDGFGLSNVAKAARNKSPGFVNREIRRPLRGVQLKDETFATLTVYSPGNRPELFNSSANRTEDKGARPNYTSNFLLQGVSEARQEKFQPITTFGNTYGFFFGEQPRMMQFTAVLLNTLDFQWEIEWWANYEEFLRGTRLTDRQVKAYMSFDDTIVEGYLTMASTTKNSQTPHEVTLSFTMWVTGVEYLVEPGDKNYPVREENIGRGGDEGTGFFNNKILEGLGRPVSSTEEVRRRNIALATANGGPGLLGKLRDGIVQDFVGRTGQKIRDAVSFLYGRNLVLPKGAAGAERAAGQATFATGSGAEALAASGLTSFTVRLPVKVIPVHRQVSSPPQIYDNIDEYVVRGEVEAALDADQLERDAANRVSTRDILAEQQAKDAFAAFGIDLEARQNQGEGLGPLNRALVLAAFGTVATAGAAAGGAQVARDLTVGNAVDKLLSDKEEAIFLGPVVPPTSISPLVGESVTIGPVSPRPLVR